MENNSVLKILVVEDNFSFAVELQILLKELGYRCAGIADSGAKALDIVSTDPPDAILMDIELSDDLSGLDVAEKIKDKNIPILFITSFSNEETFARASHLHMIGFLVKPLNQYTLITALDACLKAIPPLEKDSDISVLDQAIMIKKGKVFHKILLHEIYHIESDRNYITIYTSDNKFVANGSLKRIMEILNENVFFKSHKSHILNLAYLKNVNSNENIAIMDNGTSVPVSRRNRKVLEDKMLNNSLKF